MRHKHLTKDEIRTMGYHELCGNVDCGHPQSDELMREIDVRRAANPKLRDYTEIMR